MRKPSLKKTLLILLIATSFILGIFTGPSFAAGKYKDYPVPQSCMDQVRKEGSKLYIYDWAEWWPEELFANFTKEFGVKIVRDHYADTEEMVTKLKLNPKTPYDLILGTGPTDAVRLNKNKLLKQLTHAWLPNMTAYLKDEYKTMDFDPGNKFQFIDSIFYTTYTYNSKYVSDSDPLMGSWGLLFKGEKYKGKITMIDNAQDTFGAALKYLGYSWNTDVESEIMEAYELLKAQKQLLAAYDSWPSRLLKDEDVWISHLWIGDGWWLSRDKSEIKSVVPKEGTYYAGNTGFIPIGSKHTAAAHLFINYIFRTEVNVQLVEYIGYPPVHKHTMEFMSDAMKAWPGFIVDEEWQRKCETFDMRLAEGKGRVMREKLWEELKK